MAKNALKYAVDEFGNVTDGIYPHVVAWAVAPVNRVKPSKSSMMRIKRLVGQANETYYLQHPEERP